jgi:hypothetical protein
MMAVRWMSTLTTALVALLLMLSACATDDTTTSTPVQETTTTSTPVQETTTTSTPVQEQDELVLGEVRSVYEAACVGIVTALNETPIEEFDPEFIEPLLGLTLDDCLASGIAEEVVGPDAANIDKATAYVYGCAGVSQNLTMLLGTAEQRFDFALAGCAAPFDPMFWGPDDYRIVEDGVCYYGLEQQESWRSCQDESGAYITTTTYSYAEGLGSESFLAAVAVIAPSGSTLAEDPELARAAGQAVCTSVGGYSDELAQWMVDLERNGSGHPGVPAAQYEAYETLALTLPELATEHLCPQYQDELTNAVEEERGRQTSNEDQEWQFRLSLGQHFSAMEGGESQPMVDRYEELGFDFFLSEGYALCEGFDSGLDWDSAQSRISSHFDGVPVPELDAEQARTAFTMVVVAIHDLCWRHANYYWESVVGIKGLT